MVKKGKLKAALEAHKGVNWKLEHEKRVRKEAEKKNRTKQEAAAEKANEEQGSESEEEEQDGKLQMKEVGESEDSSAEEDGEQWETDEDEEEEDEEPQLIDMANIDDSESESESDINGPEDDEDEDEDEEEEEEEEDIALSDIEDLPEEEKDDLVPHQRLTINNGPALQKAYKSIALPLSSLPFSAHQSITSSEPTKIESIDDDLTRELAFYKQSLGAVIAAREKLRKEGVPFTRPTDYFAEMVKSDEHMGKIKGKLVEEASRKKASAEARRQRDLKKFGKQVQVAKLQERDRAKRDTLDKIKLLKRKRQSGDIEDANENDLFDVALDDAAADAKKQQQQRSGANPKRQKRDAKFGFGGKKRHAKSGDAFSSSDMTGFSAKAMKAKGSKPGKGGAAKRPGKSRRAKKA
ncbi:Ebp2-domain-containing protein [Xylona heveae TC161]|uniref:Ebp2-domain-containing protein n=1 Tax=Xylona heveae (strain CBS 132557 / TC161) TaxID=1328760 RepID=A0A165JSY0_XYLHT|nr:Ebp2-domain-containing protein [Xylona heveae TC161]KZF26581.1 Ebp2-domain-containing protein [Xylona heveae TC161]